MSVFARISSALPSEKPPVFSFKNRNDSPRFAVPYQNGAQSLGNSFLRPVRHCLDMAQSSHKVTQLFLGLGVIATAPLTAAGVCLSALGKKLNPCEEFAKRALECASNQKAFKFEQAERALEYPRAEAVFLESAVKKGMTELEEWKALHSEVEKWMGETEKFGSFFKIFKEKGLQRDVSFQESCHERMKAAMSGKSPVPSLFCKWNQEECVKFLNTLQLSEEEWDGYFHSRHDLVLFLALRDSLEGVKLSLDTESIKKLSSTLEFLRNTSIQLLEQLNKGELECKIGEKTEKFPLPKFSDTESAQFNLFKQRYAALLKSSKFLRDFLDFQKANKEKKEAIAFGKELEAEYNGCVESIRKLSRARLQPYSWLAGVKHYLQVQTQNSFGTTEKIVYDCNIIESVGNKLLTISQLFINACPEKRSSVALKFQAVLALVGFAATTPLLFVGLLFKKVGERWNGCGELRKQVVRFYEQSGPQANQDLKEIETLSKKWSGLFREIKEWLNANKIYPDALQQIEFLSLATDGKESTSELKAMKKQDCVSGNLSDGLTKTYVTFYKNQRKIKTALAEERWVDLALEQDEAREFRNKMIEMSEWEDLVLEVLTHLKILPFLDKQQYASLVKFETTAKGINVHLENNYFYKKIPFFKAIKRREKYKDAQHRKACKEALEKIHAINIEKRVKIIPLGDVIKLGLATSHKGAFASPLGKVEYQFNRVERISHKVLAPANRLLSATSKENKLYAVAAVVGFVIIAPLTLLGVVLQKVGERKNPLGVLRNLVVQEYQRGVYHLDTQEKPLQQLSTHVALLTRELQGWSEGLGLYDSLFKQVDKDCMAQAAPQYEELVKKNLPFEPVEALPVDLKNPLGSKVSDPLFAGVIEMSKVNVQMSQFKLPEKTEENPFNSTHIRNWSEMLKRNLNQSKLFLQQINQLNLNRQQEDQLLTFAKRINNALDLIEKCEKIKVETTVQQTLKRAQYNYEGAIWNLMEATKAS